MKKRRYNVTVKRRKILDDALTIVRETRAQIDPDLLEKVRHAIGGAVESYESDKYRVMQAERVPVDIKKNLSVIMKYMELKPEHTDVQQEIKTFLTTH